MRHSWVFLPIAGLSLASAGLADVETGSVEMVKLCVSTTLLVDAAGDAIDLLDANKVEKARMTYETAKNEHYEDWLTFSLVKGKNAAKVLDSDNGIGHVFVDIEDCLGGGECRADDLRNYAGYIGRNLPAACRSDFRGN